MKILRPANEFNSQWFLIENKEKELFYRILNNGFHHPPRRFYSGSRTIVLTLRIAMRKSSRNELIFTSRTEVINRLFNFDVSIDFIGIDGSFLSLRPRRKHS